ncbi:MAG: FecR protein [Candidatus Parcubacteria bacterium]|jgi:hypothetical protein
MKKVLLGFIIAGLAIVFISTSFKEKEVVLQQVNPLQSGVFVISEEKESVISKVEPISSGDVVKTDKTGTALIEGGHTTYVDPSSSLLIKEVSKEGSIFVLEGGKLWARTQKLLEKGEFYEIETGNVRAAVRGTSFGVSFLYNVTLLMVTEGEVVVWQKDEKTNDIILDTEIIVAAGEKVVVASGRAVKSKITKNEATDWFLKNNPDFIFEDQVSTSTPQKLTVKQVPQVEKPVVAPVTVAPTSAPVSTLSLISVLPTEVPFTQNSFLVTLTGRGFLKAQAVVVGKQTVPKFSVVSDSKIQFDITQVNIPPGIYDISVIDISNTVSTSAKAIKVLDRSASVFEENPNQDGFITGKP